MARRRRPTVRPGVPADDEEARLWAALDAAIQQPRHPTPSPDSRHGQPPSPAPDLSARRSDPVRFGRALGWFAAGYLLMALIDHLPTLLTVLTRFWHL